MEQEFFCVITYEINKLEAKNNRSENIFYKVKKVSLEKNKLN